jgi:hypothetical protein
MAVCFIGEFAPMYLDQNLWRTIMASRTEALAAIQKSGIMNPKLTLTEIMDVAGRLELADRLGYGEELGWWAVIGKDYVVAGGGANLEEIAKILNA